MKQNSGEWQPHTRITPRLRLFTALLLNTLCLLGKHCQDFLLLFIMGTVSSQWATGSGNTLWNQDLWEDKIAASHLTEVHLTHVTFWHLFCEQKPQRARYKYLLYRLLGIGSTRCREWRYSLSCTAASRAWRCLDANSQDTCRHTLICSDTHTIPLRIWQSSLGFKIDNNCSWVILVLYHTSQNLLKFSLQDKRFFFFFFFK